MRCMYYTQLLNLTKPKKNIRAKRQISQLAIKITKKKVMSLLKSNALDIEK